MIRQLLPNLLPRRIQRKIKADPAAESCGSIGLIVLCPGEESNLLRAKCLGGVGQIWHHPSVLGFSNANQSPQLRRDCCQFCCHDSVPGGETITLHRQGLPSRQRPQGSSGRHQAHRWAEALKAKFRSSLLLFMPIDVFARAAATQCPSKADPTPLFMVIPWRPAYTPPRVLPGTGSRTRRCSSTVSADLPRPRYYRGRETNPVTGNTGNRVSALFPVRRRRG